MKNSLLNFGENLLTTYEITNLHMETYQRNNKPLSQCYFCGEEMSPRQLEMHVKHCGCVLEPCPQQCGLYVQRQYKNHHSSWCKKDQTKHSNLGAIQLELVNIKNQIKQELSQHKLQSKEVLLQLDKCNEKIAKCEQSNTKLLEAVKGITKLLTEEQQIRSNDIADIRKNINEIYNVVTQLKFTLSQTRVDVEELRNESESSEHYKKLWIQFQDWKNNQDQILNEMKANVNKNINAEINELHKDNLLRSKSVNDLLDLNEVIIDTQDKYTEQIYQLEEEVKSVQKFIAEENITISGLWREQLEEIKKLKSKLEDNDVVLKCLVDDKKTIKEKIEGFEICSKASLSCNCSDKIEAIERTISEDLIKELIDDRNVFRERLESLECLGKSGTRNLSTNTTSTVFDETILNQQNEITLRLETLEKLTTEIQNNCNKINSTSTNNEQSNNSVSLSELSSEQLVIKRRLESLEHLTQDLEETKCKMRFKPTSGHDSAVSINGRTMWTISNFNQKLDEAKSNPTEIESSYFYTSESGYKLQLRAYLNGVGQWEGRHMIISLYVLSSRWDSQLAWPRRFKVAICLRDQEPVHRKAKDIVKSFTSSQATKDSEAPCLRMFIPHRVLYTRSYLQNNVVIIDVKAFPV